MKKSKKITTFTKIVCVLAMLVLIGVGIQSVLPIKYPNLSEAAPESTAEDYEVDLVYLWCDGNDPKFRDQKNYWLKQENKELDLQATADGRFEQVDELKYSLRSAQKYLPWVRHIYVVTNDQVPAWLNTEHPKLTVVDHTEIIPRKYLPVFNSNAIEVPLYKIPGLSEHFIYSNDDMFINRPLTKDFFFDNGKPIVRVKFARFNPGSLYQRQILRAIDLSEEAFSSAIPFFSGRNLIPHHNMDAYLKSDFSACVRHFSKEFEETLTHRFRKENSIQRFIISIWAVMKGHARIRIVSPGPNMDSLFIANTRWNYAYLLQKSNPGLFCMNDSEYSEVWDRMRVREFLEEHFPEKSEFER